MKKLLLLLAGTLAIAGAAPAVSQSDPTATVTVNVTATGFQPDSVVVRANDTVTWKNTDTKAHRVVSETNAFPASPVLQPGQSYSYRFGTPSSYSFRDTTTGETGIVHVRGSSATIGVSRLFVVYRNPVQIAGSVPNGRSNEAVTVVMTRYGSQQVEKTVLTDGDGTWSLTDRPTIRTEYKATWNGVTTDTDQAPHVNVRPLVIFRMISARQNLAYVKVAAARSYAGKVVRLQRRTNSGSWFSITKATLNRQGIARFRSKFPRGTTQARAWVGPSPGYIFGFSVTKTVRR